MALPEHALLSPVQISDMSGISTHALGDLPSRDQQLLVRSFELLEMLKELQLPAAVLDGRNREPLREIPGLRLRTPEPIPTI